MNNPVMDQPWSCEVRARGQVIRYRCAGTGRPVLFLHSGDAAHRPWPELLAALVKGHRVILPEPPPADADVTAWLDAFLEGLGSTGVRILAADRFCLPSLGLALAETDLISRLVFLADQRGDEIGLQTAVETAEALARVPFLLVPPGPPTAELIERVTRFFRAAAAVPAQPPLPTAKPA